MKPLAIAHRGKHNTIYFENTYEAFKLAGESPFYGIETDIHQTKDKIWITHHNPTIVSGGKEYVIKDLTYDELSKLPLDNNQGHDNAKVCLFTDYLTVCKESGKRPIIEFKMTPSRKDMKKLLKYIDEYMGLTNVTFISFYPWPLNKIRSIVHKKADIQWLCQDHTELKFWCRCIRKYSFDNYYKMTSQKDIDAWHKKHLEVNVWTVDDEKALRELEAMGVDYITSNVFDQNS